MRSKTLAVAAVAGFCVLILCLNHFSQDDSESWLQLAEQGCREKRFGMPDSVLPPELNQLLGSSASQRNAELKSELLTSIHEFAGQALPGMAVNINCEGGAYDPAALNVYFIRQDPARQFLWAKGLVLTRSDSSHVLILGENFWEFFAQAWSPIWAWKTQSTNPMLLSALGDYYFETYSFYLEWSVAHEMGHIRLGHKARATFLLDTNEQQQELAADREAARTMKRQYHQISGYLLGLVSETMRKGYFDTYHREWTQADGDPLTADWTIHIEQCSRSHPPFLTRSLAMLEAAAEVEQEQRDEIANQERKGIEDALSEAKDEESKIELDQLREALPPQATSSTWSKATQEIAIRLEHRVVVDRPFLAVLGHCPKAK